jgi:hypothetical protein
VAKPQLDIQANLRGIGHVLRDAPLSVPPFQRNYSWTLEEVDEYWFDLRAALSADQNHYFMGTVVLSREEFAKSMVIDGQQRLATTSLLIAAIRDVFNAGGETSRAAALQQTYLVTWSLERNLEEPRLELNDADKDFFSAEIVGQQAEGANSKRPLLRLAFDHLSKRVRQEAESAGPHWVQRLLQWIDFIDKSAQVVLMETASDADAFMVFETLNDRGLPLAVADVIKNYLLSLSRARLDDASRMWLSAVQSIEESQSHDDVTDFIRHWWSSRNGATRERDLYTFIRSDIRSQDQSLIALEELEKKAPIYAALTDPDHILWEYHESTSQQASRALLELGLEQYRPLALAVLSTLQPQAVAEILLSTVAWSVRALIVGGGGGGTAERLYAEAAVRVTNGRSVSAGSVFEELSSFVPRDREFEGAFGTRKIHRSATLRYLLNALNFGTPLIADERALVPVALFPRNTRDQEWAKYGESDEIADLSGRLGNYSLIERRDARAVPSAPLDRFEYVAAAAAKIDGALPIWQAFDQEEVDKRQVQMAMLAPEIWPLLGPSQIRSV